MLPGWCCIAIAALEQGTETADTTCALSGSISGAGKSIQIRLRMCGPPLFPTLYACCLTKRSCHFLFVAGSAFAVNFAILRSHFWYRQTVPKNETVKVLFFVFLLSGACGSQKWDRQAVPFLGPCLGSFFEVVVQYQGCRSATIWFQ